MPLRPLTPRTAGVLLTLLVILVALSVHRLQCAPPAGPYVAFSGRTMGTTYEVKVASGDLSPDGQRTIGATIQTTLENVNALMSTWRPDSELSRFNATRSTQPFAVSRETAAVFEVALDVGRRSGGAFDVTIGPVVDAWGFGASPRDVADVTNPTPPTAPELDRLLEAVGHAKLELAPKMDTLRKTHAAVEADLSALAKGFGVDEVARALDGLGHHDYLVEVGGELRARGRRRDGEPFRVAIERPDAATRSIHRIIALEEAAMATSGDYRNFIEIDGVRLSHTLDPRSGRPIRHRLASVTVVHESAVWADAWATALNVLGPEAGYALATQEGLAAYFIVRTPAGTFEARATANFEPLLDEAGETEVKPPS